MKRKRIFIIVILVYFLIGTFRGNIFFKKAYLFAAPSSPGEKGDKGDKGDPGPQGPKGDKGDKGDLGAKGDKGDVGPQGEQGEQGDEGTEGSIGEKGAQGDKGDKGDTGSQGLKGDKGDKGESGLQGIPGEKGPAGTQGIAGQKGDKGDSESQGITGQKGDKGLPGEKGSKGDTGLQGLKGDKGDIGAQGTKGDKGETGAQGLAGSKGDNGPAGPKGDKGEQGLQGLKGDKGDVGSQGIAGPKGDKGETGQQGAAGLQGPKGDKGEIGKTPSKDDIMVLINQVFDQKQKEASPQINMSGSLSVSSEKNIKIQNPALSLFVLAESYYNAGEYIKAIELYHRIKKEYPDEECAEISYLKEYQALLNVGKNDLANSLFQDFKSKYPKSVLLDNFKQKEIRNENTGLQESEPANTLKIRGLGATIELAKKDAVKNFKEEIYRTKVGNRTVEQIISETPDKEKELAKLLKGVKLTTRTEPGGDICIEFEIPLSEIQNAFK